MFITRYRDLGQNCPKADATTTQMKADATIKHEKHEIARNFSNFILIYSEVGRNLKIRSIYMPHYENKFKHWMTGAIKRIDHAMRDEGTASTYNPVCVTSYFINQNLMSSPQKPENSRTFRENVQKEPNPILKIPNKIQARKVTRIRMNAPSPN